MTLTWPTHYRGVTFVGLSPETETVALCTVHGQVRALLYVNEQLGGYR